MLPQNKEELKLWLLNQLNKAQTIDDLKAVLVILITHPEL